MTIIGPQSHESISVQGVGEINQFMPGFEPANARGIFFFFIWTWEKTNNLQAKTVPLCSLRAHISCQLIAQEKKEVKEEN